MNLGKSFWSLSRRDLFKLVPPSLASWALASPLLSKPSRSPEAASAVLGPEAKIWRADWIWEPVQVMPRGHSPGVPFFETPPFKNLFTFFRKTFDPPQGVGKAWAQISVDSRYQLYVNGQFVGRGPARFDPTWLYYDEFDLASVLRPGKNVIAVLVHYYGEKTGQYLDGGRPGDGARPGLLFECSLDGASGGTTLVKTDATWKFLRAPMWAQDAARISSALGFTELYDARKEVEGWNLPEYDDAQWGEVQVISRISGDDVPLNNPYPWDNLVPRDIPMLLEKEVVPSQVTFVGEVQNLPAGTVSMLAHQMSQETPGPLKNCTVENAQSLTSEAGSEAVIRTTPLGDADSSSAVLVLDFGREVTGRQRLELEGMAGGIVDMGVCESLANGRVTPTRNGLH
ncbi:MAG: alpha-L-rhamnosidase N-terminal domain-containing protein, partial [Terriglobia bacterium]